MRSLIAQLPRDERRFLAMVLVAMGVHALLLALINIWPASDIKNVSVHTLNFRLGEGGTLSRPQPPASLPEPDAQMEMRAAEPIKEPHKKQAAAKPKAKPVSKRVSVTAPAASQPASEQRRVPTENAAASLAAPEAPTRNVRDYGLPSLEKLFGQVEKETGAVGGPSIGDLTEVSPKVGQGLGGASGALDAKESEEIRTRYEQQISGWVAKHRYYPAEAGGRTGRVVVRVRIDRQGYVRYYGIGETSGYEVFDRAAIDMIRRANPMPSAPMNYPAGNLIEFLIPITFKP